MVAGLDSAPYLSLSVYVIGLGFPVKPGNGLKVILPVDVSTDHVPSPGTVNESPGFAVPTIRTEAGSRPSPIPLPMTSTVTGSPMAFPDEESLPASGL